MTGRRIALCVAFAAFAACAVLAAAPAHADGVRVIVGLGGDEDGAVVERHGGHVLGRLKGGALVARVPAAAVARLRAEEDVVYVEEDAVLEILGKPADAGKGAKTPAPAPAQDVPWGVERVDAQVAHAANNVGGGVTVGIIDTGIDLDHPDLAVAGAVDFVRTTGDDDNGHGTHVAGTVAALDNEIGVLGVAPGARLYAIKVLDRRGSGWLSDIAAGIDWAADRGLDVANMSLGSSSSSLTLLAACNRAETAGVLLVAAAGNSGDGTTSTTELSYPAAYASVVAVGATTSSDGLASFSSTGSFVELSAPGVYIPSTYKGGTYKTYSGTSMASPHAAGMAALLYVDLLATDPDGTVTAAEVRSALQTRVRDLGTPGRDAGFGYGIVDFDE